VAKSDAMKVAAKAAASVGLTVQQLADLMVDNAITALPETDGITEKYTLEDLGKRLWVQFSGQPRSKRAGWFDGLSDPQKTAVIVVLRDRGYSSIAIANDLQVSQDSIQRTWNAYASQMGSQVVGVRLDTIAGQLQAVYERASHMAADADDHNALWKIHREYLAALQSIGIVDSAIHRTEVTHKLDAGQMAELEKLASLRNKQGIRQAEIKLVESEDVKTDTIPSDVADHDSED